MSYQTNIQWLDGGRILAECGPMRLVIEACIGRIPQKDICIRAAKEAFLLLERIAQQRRFLSRHYRKVPDGRYDFMAEKMVRSVLAIDEELTPMAAVAGTIADGVAAFLNRWGMTRIIVNNGGDMAIRPGSDKSVNVGIRPDLTQNVITDVITLGDERTSWGVATSGLEGRSMTQGVASAATVIAGRASVADAAATSIANASYIEDKTVIQRPAEELDEQTDIPGIDVTIQAGPFTEEKKDLALSGAMKKTDELIMKRLIFGAYIAVDGKVMMTDFVRQRLVKLS
ncbi:hypothetical protein QUF75_13390 [Desulfococcaceae bacterium HSG7]|nr:hypothetical protein [Desulfococcaceae bacterium HSG7]